MAKDKLNVSLDLNMKQKFLFILDAKYRGLAASRWIESEIEREVLEYEKEHGAIPLPKAEEKD